MMVSKHMHENVALVIFGNRKIPQLSSVVQQKFNMQLMLRVNVVC